MKKELDLNRLIEVIKSCKNKLHIQTCSNLIALFFDKYQCQESLFKLQNELDIQMDKLCL